MKIIEDYNLCPEDAKSSVIALGNFDGIHKGHQELIYQAKKIAETKKRPLALMTFEPHPSIVLGYKTNDFLLTNLEQKKNLVSQLGVDYMFIVKFHQDFLKLSGLDFVEKVLVKALKVSHIVVGYNFIFGHNRSGNNLLLNQLSTQYKFGFTEISPQADKENNTSYSSTGVRLLIKHGKVKEVENFLGRKFSILGKVEIGKKIGRTIGFPTLNIHLDEVMVVPRFGVYAIQCKIEDQFYYGVANIGVRPSIKQNQTKPLLEVHLFNFSENIYGKTIEVFFIEFIREEKLFANLDLLTSQIRQDVVVAKEKLGIA